MNMICLFGSKLYKQTLNLIWFVKNLAKIKMSVATVRNNFNIKTKI